MHVLAVNSVSTLLNYLSEQLQNTPPLPEIQGWNKTLEDEPMDEDEDEEERKKRKEEKEKEKEKAKVPIPLFNISISCANIGPGIETPHDGPLFCIKLNF